MAESSSLPTSAESEVRMDGQPSTLDSEQSESSSNTVKTIQTESKSTPSEDDAGLGQSSTGVTTEEEAPSTTGTIRVKVLESSSSSVVNLENVSLDSTVAQLKLRIRDSLESHPPSQAQRIIYFGRVRTDEEILRDIIGPNSALMQNDDQSRVFHLVVSNPRHIRSTSPQARSSSVPASAARLSQRAQTPSIRPGLPSINSNATNLHQQHVQQAQQWARQQHQNAHQNHHAAHLAAAGLQNLNIPAPMGQLQVPMYVPPGTTVTTHNFVIHGPLPGVPQPQQIGQPQMNPQNLMPQAQITPPLLPNPLLRQPSSTQQSTSPHTLGGQTTDGSGNISTNGQVQPQVQVQTAPGAVPAGPAFIQGRLVFQTSLTPQGQVNQPAINAHSPGIMNRPVNVPFNQPQGPFAFGQPQAFGQALGGLLNPAIGNIAQMQAATNRSPLNSRSGTPPVLPNGQNGFGLNAQFAPTSNGPLHNNGTIISNPLNPFINNFGTPQFQNSRAATPSNPVSIPRANANSVQEPESLSNRTETASSALRRIASRAQEQIVLLQSIQRNINERPLSVGDPRITEISRQIAEYPRQFHELIEATNRANGLPTDPNDPYTHILPLNLINEAQRLVQGIQSRLVSVNFGGVPWSMPSPSAIPSGQHPILNQNNGLNNLNIPQTASPPEAYLVVNPLGQPQAIIVGPDGQRPTDSLPNNVLIELALSSNGIPVDQLTRQFNMMLRHVYYNTFLQMRRYAYSGAISFGPQTSTRRVPDGPVIGQHTTLQTPNGPNITLNSLNQQATPLHSLVPTPTVAEGNTSLNNIAPQPELQDQPLPPAADGAAVGAVIDPVARREEMRDALAPIIRVLWAVLRIAFVLYLFHDPSRSVWRLMALLGLGMLFYAIQTGMLVGVLGDRLDGLRRHLDQIIGGDLHQQQQRQEQNQVQQEQQQQQEARAVSPNVIVNPTQVQTQPEPQPADMAARLVAQRDAGYRDHFIEQVRAFERGFILFVASLWPGVGERAVRAQEERRRLRDTEENAPQEETNLNPQDNNNPGVEEPEAEGLVGNHDHRPWHDEDVEQYVMNGEPLDGPAEPLPPVPVTAGRSTTVVASGVDLLDLEADELLQRVNKVTEREQSTEEETSLD